jgi:two-component system sensor kinase FixL
MYLVMPFTGRVYGDAGPLPATAHSRLLPVIAAALVFLIFVIDTFTRLQIAVAVLYVLVVLLSANFSGRRGILLWSLACIGLTLASLFIKHGRDPDEGAVARYMMSLLAIGSTTFLTMRIRKARDILLEQAKALQRSEAYLADAQKLSQTGSFVLNPATRELVFSPELYRIFEYDQAQPVTVELALARAHPDDAETVRDHLQGRIEALDIFELQYRLLMPDGRVKHIRVISHPTADQSGGAEYIGAIMDITAAKHAEEALFETQAALAHAARITTLGELTASIAHEVNQPLTGIVINGEVCLRLLNQQPPQLDELRGAIEDIISDGRRAGEVIRRLRALSRKDDTTYSPLGLNEVIHETLPLVRRELVNCRISLKLDLAPDLPTLRGDRIQLQQVITNLVMNAIQAMSPVTGRARDLVIRSGRNDEEVFLAVSDTGPGIDPENMKKVFSAFFTTKTSGMGVGLAICRSIVEAHGGRIRAANNDGHGATFEFVLPIKEEEAQ